jgi:hypothetical protein
LSTRVTHSDASNNAASTASVSAVTVPVVTTALMAFIGGGAFAARGPGWRTQSHVSERGDQQGSGSSCGHPPVDAGAQGWLMGHALDRRMVGVWRSGDLR